MRRISGVSMEPLLAPGNLAIFIRKKIRVGDIILFSHDGRDKVKYVKSISNQKVYTMGSNTNFSTDSRLYGLIDEQCIKGVLVWSRG